MHVPDHQCPSHDVLTTDFPTFAKLSPEPKIERVAGSGTLDLDQLAVVLARLLEQ